MMPWRAKFGEDKVNAFRLTDDLNKPDDVLDQFRRRNGNGRKPSYSASYLVACLPLAARMMGLRTSGWIGFAM